MRSSQRTEDNERENKTAEFVYLVKEQSRAGKQGSKGMLGTAKRLSESPKQQGLEYRLHYEKGSNRDVLQLDAKSPAELIQTEFVLTHWTTTKVHTCRLCRFVPDVHGHGEKTRTVRGLQRQMARQMIRLSLGP